MATYNFCNITSLFGIIAFDVILRLQLRKKTSIKSCMCTASKLWHECTKAHNHSALALSQLQRVHVNPVLNNRSETEIRTEVMRLQLQRGCGVPSMLLNPLQDSRPIVCESCSADQSSLTDFYNSAHDEVH